MMAHWHLLVDEAIYAKDPVDEEVEKCTKKTAEDAEQHDCGKVRYGVGHLP